MSRQAVPLAWRISTPGWGTGWPGFHLPAPTTASSHMEAPPALRKFNPPGMAERYPTEEQIAACLRASLGIDDAALGKALAAHLTARLDDLDAVISRVQGRAVWGHSAACPIGPVEADSRPPCALEGRRAPGSFDELLATQVPYGEADMTSWRQEVAGLQKATCRLDLFAAFADIEDAFEPFEERITALGLRVEREIGRDHR